MSWRCSRLLGCRHLDVTGSAWPECSGSESDGLRRHLGSTFTLTSDASPVTTGTPIVVSPTARVAEIATAIKATIDASGLQVSATVDGDVLKLRGLSNRVDPETSLSFAASGSITGNPLDDAFKVTNYSLNVVLTDALLNGVDGSSITIFDGEMESTFEFDNLVPAGRTYPPYCRAIWSCRWVPIRHRGN